MREKKTKLRFYSIADYEQEADWLSEMHRQGWAFDRTSAFPVLYHFRRCEPEEVVYQLDYNRDVMENREVYLQMFRDCGWEYIQDRFGFSYFRKSAAEMAGEEGIFSDNVSRMDMLRRVFRGQLLGIMIIFFTIWIPQLCLSIQRNGPGSGFTLVWWAILGFYLGIFYRFVRKYWRLKQGGEK